MLSWLQSLAAIFLFLTSFNITLAAETMESEQKKPSVTFELEFIARADLYRTANFLRTQGFSATVVPEEIIVVEGDSYNKLLEKLAPLVPNLPDIARFVWKHGDKETILYEAQEADLFVTDQEITDNRKVLQEWDDVARMTIVLRDDKQSTIKYQSLVRQIEKMGYTVTFAEGYMDAGWIQFPAIEIKLPNNIISFKKAILELSVIPEINRFLYNRGKSPRSNDYIITFQSDSDLDVQLTRLLGNGIEVYKIDKLLHRLFIHFPQTEARNKIKLEQIKMLDDLVMIKNIHENQELFTKEEFSRNVKHIWLDIPEEILESEGNYNQYAQKLNDLAREEVIRLKQKGMIIVHYGVYTEAGEVLIPEVVFTHRDVDTPKANDLMKYYNTSATFSFKPKARDTKSSEAKTESKVSKKSKQKSQVNKCSNLFDL